MARVVLISPYGPSIVKFRGPLLRSMVDRGHEVTALSPEPEPPAGFEALGARYVQVPLERAGTNPLSDVRSLLRWARLLRRLRPDVVLSYTAKPVIFGTLAARLARVPRRCALVTGLGYVFIADGSRKQRLTRRVMVPLYRAGLASATTVFFQNPDDERDLRESGVLGDHPHVVQVAGSGVDTDLYAQRPLPDGPTTFLLIARLLRDKGIREYVEAARRLRARWPAARFVLVGPTDPNPAALPLAEVEGWVREGVIDWRGGTDDVRPALAECSVFVLPSYREGTPRTVLEAMSVGRPIVTTDAPGCRETTVDGDNGFLVPVKDAGALAEAMERFLREPALLPRMATRSREVAVSKFDVRAVNEVMLRAMGL